MHMSVISASEIKSSHTTCYRFDLQKKAANDTTIECSTAVSGKPVLSLIPSDITTFVTLSLSCPLSLLSSLSLIIHSITLSLQMNFGIATIDLELLNSNQRFAMKPRIRVRLASHQSSMSTSQQHPEACESLKSTATDFID